MSTSTQEYMEAIEHLPKGATLIFQKVSWDDYEALTYDLLIAGHHVRQPSPRSGRRLDKHLGREKIAIDLRHPLRK